MIVIFAMIGTDSSIYSFFLFNSINQFIHSKVRHLLFLKGGVRDKSANRNQENKETKSEILRKNLRFSSRKTSDYLLFL